MTSLSTPGRNAGPHTRSIDTVVVGGGQAGLAAARELTRRGVDCLVLEAAEHVAEQWRHQYDSLRLFTPNKISHLPGAKLPGSPNGFAAKDEVADYLQHYARTFDLPVLTGIRVERVARQGDGFALATSAGPFRCRNLVVATGPFGGQAKVPALADALDPRILQLHSSQYRRPGQLRPGPVLVVGASHSGCDIAYELAATHRTHLSGRDTGEIPISWDSPAMRLASWVLAFRFGHVLTRRTAPGRRARREVMEHGARRLRVKKADLLGAGVLWNEHRVVGAADGMPLLADGARLEVENVVWATGFRHDYSWLGLGALDDSGWPREYRGVARDVPGLYFCGLSFQYSMASMTLNGVGRDARYIARRIAAAGRRTAAPVS
ncbi:flavin-containing monooxygenase [Glutamicibacter protophormiae]|uniref:flavin-containing monooxygenase n=1 Tax=Glutamicibacter protophormiae TaxID=37930 RepID=UPI003324E1E2